MAVDPRMSVYVIDNDSGHSRLGLSVGRVVGNAVTRNRIRRRIKEAFRKNKNLIPVGVDIVCVVKPGETLREQDYFELLLRLVVMALGRPAKPPRAGTP
jgi:ribonuclease P protein component